MDDNAAAVGEWAPPDPSPRTFFSSLLSDNFSSKPFSDVSVDNGTEGPASESERKNASNKFGEEDERGSRASDDHLSDSNVSFCPKPSLKGSLAERMAARAGFNALKLNTANIRSANLPPTSPEARSPYLTIPAGLSPTTLLESPVFLSNSLAQPSPTTGKILFPQFGERTSFPIAAAPKMHNEHRVEDGDTSSFTFKPHGGSNSSYFASSANKVALPVNHHQTLCNLDVSVQSQHHAPAQTLDAVDNRSHSQPELQLQKNYAESSVGKDSTNMSSNLGLNESHNINADQSSPPDDQDDGEGEPRGEISSMVVGAPSEDGYNWRKYGQKQVKGSEYPRSYYKCTHPNCQVKKKVERSHEGHITEIIYKGAHNHPKPPPNRRSGFGSTQLPHEMENSFEQQGSLAGLDGEQQSTWASTQRGSFIGNATWMHEGMETASSAAVPAEFGDPSAPTQAQSGARTEIADAVDVSSTMSDEDDEDDRGTHGSVSLGGEDEGDESESKRRKIDACVTEMSGATRAIREPRVVVQTTSEVDILDDGYRWRKYGQKVVKGNPNPRSYYKCTNAGCTVRKHVERASHDLKSVITTYEGKHNHDVPAARNSSHISTGPPGGAAATPVPSYISRPEPSPAHDSITGFDRSALRTFGLPGRQQIPPTSGFTFGMNQPILANLAMAGLSSATQGKIPGHPIHHSYFGQQEQRKINEMGFMMPKGELKEEPLTEPSVPVSSGSTVYHQLMSRLPLG